MAKGSLEIDNVIHQPARLQIMTHLFVVEEADVLFLKRKTGLTWGNISSHMTKLENKGYIAIKKEIKDKKTYTTLKLTEKGRIAFKEYHKIMQELLNVGNE
ncbi:MAG: winged helix-turn-helix domain-containing protein [Candidatus Kariarchaeaceae archaeon]